MEDIVKILQDAGYKTVVGHTSVQDAIKSCSDGSTKRLCSGFKVFPDGTKCDGCKDCFRPARV